MTTFIRARVTIPGIHHWPSAPEQFRPLRNPHRHLFTFEVEVETLHGDRSVEFLDLGHDVRIYLQSMFSQSEYWDCLDFDDQSCETLAKMVLDHFEGARRVTVWEDMENAGGAER